ncbi:MAG: FadR/GntR family transcriptional regulator [Actinomycetota bacterium]|nr:FadR/GntR family transcriptional regulator [Actinomycetota bacterium]
MSGDGRGDGSADVRGSRRPPRVRNGSSLDLQERIKELILERKLPAGHALPTEFELMDELNVSRNPLREALKALQAVGVVDVRRGFGMYVGRMSLGGLVDELTFHGRLSLQTGRESLLQLVEMREILERGLIEYVLERQVDSDFTDLESVLARMETEAVQGTHSDETDRAFHELLYARLGNPLVSRVLGAFWDALHELQSELPPIAEEPLAMVHRHRDVYEAVRNGNEKAAVAAMAEHFDGIRKRLAMSSPRAPGKPSTRRARTSPA